MELEVTWGRAARVWWAYFWRNLVAVAAGSLIGIALGAILGFILGAAGARAETIRIAAFPIGIVVGLLVSIVPIRLVLGKDFGAFRLVLLRNPN
jgi:hypothetical protein